MRTRALSRGSRSSPPNPVRSPGARRVPGRRGSSPARATVAATAITPTPANAPRQPVHSAAVVAAGTPRTEAAETPPKITAVARPMSAVGTSRGARPPARAQKPPMAIPSRTRAPRTTAKCPAAAVARFAAATSAIRTTRTARRSAPAARRAISGAATAATRPGTVTIRPAVPADTLSSDATGVSRPTGSSSAVITVKMPSVTAPTRAQLPWPLTWTFNIQNNPLKGPPVGRAPRTRNHRSDRRAGQALANQWRIRSGAAGAWSSARSRTSSRVRAASSRLQASSAAPMAPAIAHSAP